MPPQRALRSDAGPLVADRWPAEDGAQRPPPRVPRPASLREPLRSLVEEGCFPEPGREAGLPPKTAFLIQPPTPPYSAGNARLASSVRK